MSRACLLYVVGNRFGLATTAPVIEQMRQRMPRARHVVVVAGEAAEDSDLDLLGLAEVDYRFGAASDSPVTATTSAMERVERVAIVEQPSFIVVTGNSTPTLAGALTALSLGIRCAHLDAGLRNFDRRVSGEINRVIVDSFAELLFVSCEHGMANLRAEGIDSERIHLVGTTLADTLTGLAPQLRESMAAERLGLRGDPYLLVALRDATFATGPRLAAILDRLVELSATMTVVLPVAAAARETVGRYLEGTEVRLTEPLDYLSFLALEANADAVLTDRGGVQAETTHFGRPCFTLLDSTERVTTVLRGTNRLLGKDPDRIAEIPAALRERPPLRETLPFWDGRAAARIANVLTRELAPPAPSRIAAPSWAGAL